MKSTTVLPLNQPLLRGDRRPRVALIGRRRTGKSSIFRTAASPKVHHERLAGSDGSYEECVVEVNLDQISLVDLPAIESLHHLRKADRVELMYLLWGDRWPAIAHTDAEQPETSFAAPDVLVLVADATMLERDLELALELSLLGRPMVIALNRMDEARNKGLFINIKTLSERLGIPVIPTVAHMGKGITALFEAVVVAARSNICPLPHPPSPHLAKSLASLDALLAQPHIAAAFQVPHPLLLLQIAENDDYFTHALSTHFSNVAEQIGELRSAADRVLPRPLSEEIHADRHYRAAILYEAVTSIAGPDDTEGWRRGLDRIFLHPRWGLVGSLAVFASVLFVVFELSSTLDRITSGPLSAWIQQWQPHSTIGIIGRAIADGLVGLIGIVIPYMLPLVLLLVILEESGIMHRVAFVVDRGFHRIGLHGGVALPFLIGLGCNVPAISSVAANSSGRDRVIAAMLITFVPCSARSAVILALGGKYLGGIGVFGIFVLTLMVIAVVGNILARRFSQSAPGLIQEIPAYSLPTWPSLWRNTWSRTSDIVTIVTPLLIAGSIVLALLSHWGGENMVNAMLRPITVWWLDLPESIGVPILFGVLRKELSLLMIYQALGTHDIAGRLDAGQIMTYLIFLTFYFPCVSTFAVMLRALGWRQAFYSVFLSIFMALAIAGIVRLAFSVYRLF